MVELRAVNYFNYMKIRMFHSSLTEKRPIFGGKIGRVMMLPFEKFYGYVPDTDMIKKFGSTTLIF